MNQKRITNQILNQKNYTLNSTLNYLFNISNMKKLFSYLLISSMVVLSSCTNYDDQFDDLNTQINTLKSQIEGFSSLSSGLTALQGTVASLQSAINNIPVTPATDISGLESSLETLAASVAELQAALANAATAAEVAALQTALDAQQADLTELLAQNNIYAPTNGVLTVSSQSELDFALALGDKVSIINGGVNITHTSTMSDANVATLMGKMVSVTGTVTYTGTVTSTVAGEFTKLTGALNVNINQSGSISLPALVSTGALSLSGDDLTTSVSLPALTHVASGLGALSFSKATTVDLSALTAYDGAISITTDDNATVDLSAFSNLTTTTGVAATTFESLTVVNATILKAPLFAKGEIVADALASVDLPKWQSLSASSSFAKAKTVVLPAVDPGKAAGAVIAIDTVFDKATSVHIIAAASTKTSVTTANHMDVTSSSSNLETLILGGTFSDITITAGADLTSLTFDGSALNVSITGTDLSAIDIPYTSLAKGSLTVTNNLDLDSLTASKVNTLKGLTITGNTSLETVSFAALKASAASPRVAISNNDLTIDNIQLANADPVVAHKITSADFSGLSTFLGAAADLVVAASDSVVAKADNVSQITSGTGVVDTTVDLATAVYKSSGATSNDVLPTVIVNKIFTAATDNSVTGKAAKFDILITDLEGDASIVTVGGESVTSIPYTGLQLYYDVLNWKNEASTATALENAGVKITGVGRGQNTAVLNVKSLAGATAAVYELGAGMGDNVSIISSSSSSLSEIATGLMTALNAGDGVLSKYYTVAATDGTTGSDITFTRSNRGSAASAFDLSFSAKALSGTYPSGVASTTTSYGFSSTASVVAGDNEASSDSAYLTFEAITRGTAGAKTVTITGAAATQLVASGVNRTVGADGDDENVVTAVTDVAATTSNATTVAQNGVDYTAVVGS